MRDYAREREVDKKRNETIINIRINKDILQELKAKLAEEEKTTSEFLKQKINEYLGK